jgi:hypothetical protein
MQVEFVCEYVERTLDESSGAVWMAARSSADHKPGEAPHLSSGRPGAVGKGQLTHRRG